MRLTREQLLYDELGHLPFMLGVTTLNATLNVYSKKQLRVNLNLHTNYITISGLLSTTFSLTNVNEVETLVRVVPNLILHYQHPCTGDLQSGSFRDRRAGCCL